jgi:hypothetical protein
MFLIASPRPPPEPDPRELTYFKCQAMQHHCATEFPSRFVRVRREAPSGWKVDSLGRAIKDESAWNVPELTGSARARYREFITRSRFHRTSPSLLPWRTSSALRRRPIGGQSPARGGGEADERTRATSSGCGSAAAQGGQGTGRPGSAAPSSGALAVAARQLGMSEQDIIDLALARSARRSMVVVRLGTGHALLAWSKTPMPALSNLAELGHASAFAGVDRERILYDDSAPTELERADGNWGAVARRGTRRRRGGDGRVACIRV